jgi:hypothetical protein
MSFPTATTPWFLITTALVVSFWNAPDTDSARSFEPEGLFEIITGWPTTILASSITCWNYEDIETPIVKGL